MKDEDGRSVGTVALLYRYPVKSMLGEACGALSVTPAGIAGDRAWAVLDDATGKVASAKRPKLWRSLLACTARTLEEAAQGAHDSPVEIEMHDGTRHRAGDPALDGILSALIGRSVRLASTPPDDPELDRAHPEAQLAEGPDADVASDILKMGAASPPGTFLDYAPLHLITTATLDGLGDGPGDGRGTEPSHAAPDGPMEALRYRPNVVIVSPSGTPWFPENDWLGGTIRVGDTVALRVVLQTPRCAIPALAHGMFPARPGALRTAADRNRVDIPGFGSQPCAGVYAEVLRPGVIRPGDTVTFAPADTTAA